MSTAVTTSVPHSEASPVAPQLPPSACGCLCGSFALMSDYCRNTPAYHASHQEHGIEAAASHLPVSAHVVIHITYDQDTTARVRRDLHLSRAVMSSQRRRMESS